MNLPNAITVGRIAATPLICLLPLVGSWEVRLLGWLLYLAAAITDYYDGMLARSRGMITDLGKLLDPLADKLLLLSTLVPMYLLQRPADDWLAHAIPGIGIARAATAGDFPFDLGGVMVPLPWYVVAVVLGRELVMTIFRQLAARRGVIISAIGPAKWKTGFQSTWVGVAYFWFFFASWTRVAGWGGSGAAHAMSYFTGAVGTSAMAGAVFLTVYSLWLYVRRYGGLFVGRAHEAH